MKAVTLTIAVLLLAQALPAEAPYDLLLKGGHVIDPANRLNRVMDVAIAGGKIARVAPSIDPIEARRTVDVSRPVRHAGAGRYPRSRLRRHRYAGCLFGRPERLP